MHRGQVIQITNQPPTMTNTVPTQIQNNAMRQQDAILEIAFAIESLKERFANLLGPNFSNDHFAQANEALPPSPTPTPCAQNLTTCLGYPTTAHLHAGQTYNELAVPNDPFANNSHFANTSYHAVPKPVAMDPKPDDIDKGKRKSKTGKTPKRDANEAENIKVHEPSTFLSEPEIQYPEIQYAPRDGSVVDHPDLPQATRLEHQITFHFNSSTTPSKIIVEFQKT